MESFLSAYNRCMLTAASILKDTFGYDTFRPLQQEVINNILAAHDTLAVMPTGGGKSLCYQIPALLFEGLTVVVSPLIALMKDQVEQMQASGVPAVFLNSTLTAKAYSKNMQDVSEGRVKLLYLAPETLLTPRIFSLLDSLQVALFVIDEAHCISEWGHDFRPDYRQLVEVRQRYPQAVCLALTATATTRVRSDIKSSLGFSNSDEFVASFDRENLYIEVAQKFDGLKQTLNFLREFKNQSGIIYCFSRKQVDELTADLVRKGYSARAYHAGLADAERQRNQEAFIRDDAQVIVATIAFGMGINKPNVRFVLHHDLPKSIEGYYQEIGRAGRDGLPAHCLLLYNYSDVAKLNYFIEEKRGTEKKVASQQLDAIVRYAEDAQTCRRRPLLGYFGEMHTVERCGNCDNCLSAAGTPRIKQTKTENEVLRDRYQYLLEHESEDRGQTTRPARASKSAMPQLKNMTIPAQKFLSCIKRTGEEFPAKYVVDVLLGFRTTEIEMHGHESLSTYGIGGELTSMQWMTLSRQLGEMGFYKKDPETYALSLTDKALDVLRKRNPILIPLESPVSVNKQKLQKPESQTKEPEYNHALFALLRQKRKHIADIENVPPYVIFSDRTLIEMSTYYPQSPARMINISGVGKVKLQKYGEDFLAVLRQYCKRHKLSERVKES